MKMESEIHTIRCPACAFLFRFVEVQGRLFCTEDDDVMDEIQTYVKMNMIRVSDSVARTRRMRQEKRLRDQEQLREETGTGLRKEEAG
jgi:hypothetical protein